MIKQATPETLLEAVALLDKGELVAFPTETVFGLGADATNDQAVAKLYDVKQRPRDKAFAIMLPDLEQAKQYAIFDERALTLANVFWPGPLSMVLALRENSGLSETALAGNATISIRIPKHKTALDVLQACQNPLAVPSANSSGHLSSVTALDVARDLGHQVELILADASPVIGLESTIIDMTKTPAVILRLGAISQEEIETLIGETIMTDVPVTSPLKLNSTIRLNAIDVKQGEAFLGFGNTNYIGVENIGFVKDMPQPLWRNLSAQSDLNEATANLYTMLQELDQSGATTIAIQRIPDEGLGKAINDRLKRMVN